MKKFTLLAALVSAVFFIAGCASQCHTACDQPAPCHKDMKGEVH